MALTPITLYNSLSRKKERVVSIRPKEIRLYTCGPTVYDYAHIGNLRSFIFADTLVRTLSFVGYRLRFVRNITDVGHLTDDADLGEDKIELASRKNNMSAWGLARMYTKAFHKDAKKVNLLSPTYEPKATDHISLQINFIRELERRNLTYRAHDGIYFNTSAFSAYGALVPTQGLPEELESRIHTGDDKKSIRDFALWKFSSPKGPKRQMEWPSPWGVGYPGWHIECSAMSRKYLSFPFDIHTGGIDHLPIHHTNEIAQNDSVFGKGAVHYWLHNEFVMVDNEKMSKSKSNFYRLDDLEKRGYSPLSFRYQCLSAHYRTRLNFTWEGIGAAQNALTSLRREVRRLSAMTKQKKSFWTLPQPKNKTDAPTLERFTQALTDDLNTPLALSVIWEMIRNKETTLSPHKKLATLLACDQVLGLELEKETKRTSVPRKIRAMVTEREKMRAHKEWELADRLRKKIEKMGFQVEDHTSGPLVFSTE